MAKVKPTIEEFTATVAKLNKQISVLSQEGYDVEMDFGSDDESDADLIDLI